MRLMLIIIVLCGCVPGWAADTVQREIPPATLESLQETFGRVRDLLWEHSDEFWHQGQFERCIAMTRLIAEIAPSDYEAYDTGAWLMQNDFGDDEAEAFLRLGLKRNPDTYDMHFYVGYFLYMHERYAEAVEVLEKAKALGAPFLVRHTLAHSYEHAGRVQDALNEWEQLEKDGEAGIPRRQIDRIKSGGPPANVPATTQRWRQERKEREGKD